jgi:small subunit ribosomal protein S20
LPAKKRKLTALKRIRQNIRRAARRRSVKSALRTIAKRAEQAPDALAGAQSSIDRAVGGGIIHKNAAARRKSRLMKKQAQGNKRR